MTKKMSRRSAWGFLKSMRLAVVLFIVIAVASLFGAILVQRASRDVYMSKYGPFAGHLILILGLDDVFHSFWYGALLLLLSVNVLVCTLTRLKGAVRAAFGVSFKDEPILRTLKSFREMDFEGSLEEAKEILSRELGRKRYRTRTRDFSSGSRRECRIFAAKGRVSSLGPTLVHFGILFVLIGGAWTGMRGYRYNKILKEGESFSLPEADFTVHLDSFSIERTEDGEVKQYKSKVTVIEGHEVVLQKTVMVNYPLVHKGIYVYQSAYGSELRRLERASLALTDRNGQTSPLTFDVPFGERTPIGDTELSVEIADFVPDFVMDDQGVVTSRSEEHRNPACMARVFRGDTLQMESWLFLNFPKVHSSVGERYHLQLLAYEPEYYTVLQVARTPGLTFVYVSFILASVGLFLSFYFSHRRVWASILAAEEGRVKLLIGGRSRKNQSEFEREFDLIVSRLKD